MRGPDPTGDHSQARLRWHRATELLPVAVLSANGICMFRVRRSSRRNGRLSGSASGVQWRSLMTFSFYL
jgi:hypothetical protein